MTYWEVPTAPDVHMALTWWPRQRKPPTEERPSECHRFWKAVGTKWLKEIVNLFHTEAPDCSQLGTFTTLRYAVSARTCKESEGAMLLHLLPPRSALPQVILQVQGQGYLQHEKSQRCCYFQLSFLEFNKDCWKSIFTGRIFQMAPLRKCAKWLTVWPCSWLAAHERKREFPINIMWGSTTAHTRESANSWAWSEAQKNWTQSSRMYLSRPWKIIK